LIKRFKRHAASGFSGSDIGFGYFYIIAIFDKKSKNYSFLLYCEELSDIFIKYDLFKIKYDLLFGFIVLGEREN